MKKLTALALALVCVLGLAGCSDKTVNIDLPFEIDHVENVEVYHFVGAPLFQQKRKLLLQKIL